MSQNIILTLSLTHFMPADNNANPQKNKGDNIPNHTNHIRSGHNNGYKPYRYKNSWGIAGEVVIGLGYSHEADLDLEVLGYERRPWLWHPLEFQDNCSPP